MLQHEMAAIPKTKGIATVWKLPSYLSKADLSLWVTQQTEGLKQHVTIVAQQKYVSSLFEVLYSILFTETDSFLSLSPAALVPAWFLPTVICAQVSQQHLLAV